MDIHLHHFISLAGTGVCYVHGDLRGCIGSNLRRIDSQTREFKGGIAHAISKWKQRSATDGRRTRRRGRSARSVFCRLLEEHKLSDLASRKRLSGPVLQIAAIARWFVVIEIRQLPNRLRECNGQLAARINLAKNHVRRRRPALLAEVPSL